MTVPHQVRGAQGGGARGALRAKAGFTLVEIMLALTVLLFALMAFSKAMIASSESSATTQEIARADQAARRILETLQAEDFSEIFIRYDSDGENDPGVANSAPGAGFAVEGLDPLPEDGDGMVGEIQFPEGGAGTLCENLNLSELGLPRDLNGDGAVDNVDHSGDYVILPVRVVLAWKGQNGPARVELKTILTDYQ